MTFFSFDKLGRHKKLPLVPCFINPILTTAFFRAKQRQHPRVEKQPTRPRTAQTKSPPASNTCLLSANLVTPPRATQLSPAETKRRHDALLQPCKSTCLLHPQLCQQTTQYYIPSSPNLAERAHTCEDAWFDLLSGPPAPPTSHYESVSANDIDNRFSPSSSSRWWSSCPSSSRCPSP